MPCLTNEQTDLLLKEIFGNDIIIPATDEEVAAIEADYLANPEKPPYEGLPPWWDDFCKKHGIR